MSLLFSLKFIDSNYSQSVVIWGSLGICNGRGEFGRQRRYSKTIGRKRMRFWGWDGGGFNSKTPIHPHLLPCSQMQPSIDPESWPFSRDRGGFKKLAGVVFGGGYWLERPWGRSPIQWLSGVKSKRGGVQSKQLSSSEFKRDLF